jgi:hypothetical protein
MARDSTGDAAQEKLAETLGDTNDERPLAGNPRPEVASPPATKSQDPEEMRRAVAQLERENRRLRKRCEEAEIEISYLERSLKNTENTLSFRLGYALIHSTKSLEALRALPAVLVELSRDSRRRRGDPSQGSALLAALRSPGILTGRFSRIRGKDAAKKTRPDHET